MQRNKKMKNIYVMPTVKERASNKTVYVEIMQRKKVRASKGRREGMKGVTFSWWGERRRAEEEATVNGGIRSYLKENEWTKSSKVAARSNKEDEIHGENETSDEEMRCGA